MFPCCNPFYLRQSSSLLLNSRCVLTAAGVCGFIAFSRPTRPVTNSAYSVAPSARNRKLSWSNTNRSSCCDPVCRLGGQYGLHNSSDHCPHSAAGRRWRLVRPRALVLGCMYRKTQTRSAAEEPSSNPARFVGFENSSKIVTRHPVSTHCSNPVPGLLAVYHRGER